MFAFISNVDKNSIVYSDGSNPFTVNVDGKDVCIYIKNLSPAQLSNNNPDIWRIQLPVKDEFEGIKDSENLFVLLGYDADNHVFTSWNPYWCKQRLNVGKSVSLYSRLSLQERVSKSGEIEQMDLNNDGNVVCIPQHRIGEYIQDIKKYYPEETTFIAKGSSIQKKLVETSATLFEAFKEAINEPDEFLKFMMVNGVSRRSARDYARHVRDMITWGLVDKYKECFLAVSSIDDYQLAVKNFLSVDEINAINLKNHRWYGAGLKHYLSFFVARYDNSISDSVVPSAPEKVEVVEVAQYPLNEFDKLIDIENDLFEKLSPYVVGEEYPDYDEMINIAVAYYPSSVSDNMSYNDWMNLLTSINWKKKRTSRPAIQSPAQSTSSEKTKGASKVRTKTIRVTRPDGSVIQHGFVVNTYETIIKESYPDLIMELGIKHAGVNIVSTEYDEKYRDFQREIGDGFLLMVNSSTEQKYEDLCVINNELELGLKIELVDKEGTAAPALEYTKSDGSRFKLRVTFPNGRTIQYNKVLDTLLEVVEYAGPERVAGLNIIVCFENMMARQPYEKYAVACKPVSEGWYVNTASDTMAKYNQICYISKAFDLGLIVEIV